MFYDLQDSHTALKAKVNSPPVVGTRASQVPQVNTAAVTNMLGLPVEPSDTTQLTDGTKLTYVAAERKFKFL